MAAGRHQLIGRDEELAQISRALGRGGSDLSATALGAALGCREVWICSDVDGVLDADPSLENTAAGYAPRPSYRPVTKFENRGIKLGHGVWDLVFTRK